MHRSEARLLHCFLLPSYSWTLVYESPLSRRIQPEWTTYPSWHLDSPNSPTGPIKSHQETPPEGHRIRWREFRVKPCAIMRKCSRLVAWWPGGLRIRENPSVSESVDSPWSYSRAPGAKLISRESQVKRPPSSEFEALRRSNHRDDTLQYSDNTD